MSLGTGHISSTPSDMLRVVRGPYTQRDRWAEVKDEIQYGTMESFDDFRNYMLSKPGSCESYAGVRHKNVFRVNKPITLLGVGFFGPHNEQYAKYDVTIQVENNNGQSVAKCNNIYEAYNGKIFDVILDHPVQIPSHINYTVLFELDGPDTSFCPLEKLITEVGDFSGPDLAWQFQTGSKQMPIIYYALHE